MKQLLIYGATLHDRARQCNGPRNDAMRIKAVRTRGHTAVLRSGCCEAADYAITADE